MNRLFLSIAFAGVSCFTTAALAQKPVDWATVNKETLADFQALIRIDSSNPPGNETAVAKKVAEFLQKDGIESKLVGAEPDRLSLIARLKGNGKKKPILIFGHTDVVGVQREKWTEDPFGAKVVDGYVWGRGSIDDKPVLTGALMTMLLLKRSGVQLDRDIILVAEAGEEGGSPNRTFGISYLIDHNYADIDAEYCLSEGGNFSSVGGKTTHQIVQLSEKEGRRMQLVATGISGHGSMPRMDNSIVHLSTAVSKVGNWQPPMNLIPITKMFMEGMAKALPADEAQRYRDLFDEAKTQSAQDWFRVNDIRTNSMLRTSISPNIIQGGFRANVIPSEATAYLDIRAIPGEDMDQFKARIEKLIDDPAVKVVAPEKWPEYAPTSSVNTEMFKALASVQAKDFPGTVIIPSMHTGGTDMRPLRVKGQQCYGIGPTLPVEDLVTHAMHSDNERLPVQSLYDFVRYEFDVVSAMAVQK